MTSRADSDYSAVLRLPFSGLGIRIENGVLYRLDFVDLPDFAPQEPLAKEVMHQIKAYLNDPGFQFSLPLAPPATIFQSRIRDALIAVPAGQPISYGDMARSLQSAPRAVGQACRRNPLPLVVPCHRVVGRNHIGGFSGDLCGGRVSIKEWLLCHEAG